jgi:uncharacterized delta-60 repeat protein
MKRAAIKLTTLLILALLLSSGLRNTTQYAADELDPTFGTGGKVTTDFGNTDAANGVAIQADGKIIAAGDTAGAAISDFALARYNVDGSLDATFGTGGKVTTDFSGMNDSGRAVAIQTDGKIVVAGYASSLDFALARYNSDGSLDTSFGSGGKVTTDFSGDLDQAYSIALQTDGKIIAAGKTGSGAAALALARYNSDGSLDSSFGSGGKVTTTFTSSNDAVLGLAVQLDGRIIAAGFSGIPPNFVLARYNVDGSLDPTFGSAGKVTTDFSGRGDTAKSVSIQKEDGKIVVAGYSGLAIGTFDFALARYEVNGSLDTAFGTGGRVITDFIGNDDFGNGMGILEDGKIVVAGSARDGSTGAIDFALARYNADGSPDTAFGTGGKMTTDFSGNLDIASSLKIQNDGRIVVAGFAQIPGRDFALARYRAAPTAVTLASFNATEYDTRVYLEWQTGFESDNLGFNIYREQGGERTRVNQQLVAGSALRPGFMVRAGETYAWWDEADSKEALYWLEDVDLDGQSTWHGPFPVKPAEGAPPSRGPAVILSKLGSRQPGPDPGRQVERVAAASSATAGQYQAQSLLARRRAVKLFVKREGWYRVTQPELVRAGLNPNLDARTLQLFVDGKEQSIFVDTPDGKSFDASSAVEFYGYGLDSPSTDARVYWLYAGDKDGKRISRSKSAGPPSASSSFTSTVERRDRTVYFSALLNGERENFFGAIITTAPVDQSITLTHVDWSGSEQGSLEVNLQGVTSSDHRVVVELNGTHVGEIAFTGQQQGTGKFSVQQSWLREGVNIVRLIAQNGARDISLVDLIRLSYRHAFAADDDTLKFTVTGKQRVTVEGFSSKAIRVFDVTDAYNVRELVGEVSQSEGGFAVAIASHDMGTRTLIALTEERRKKPASVEPDTPSSWRVRDNAADFVIITSPELRAAIQPLKDLRQAEGYKTAIVEVDDIYDEFNFGHKSPQAIRDFLSYANGSWSVAPRFILFAGDATFDPKNYLGLGGYDVVPTKLIDTTYLETASDDWFADFNGDGLSDVAVGRLPVRTFEEMSVIVSKLYRYSRSQPPESVLLVSDANDGFDFEQASAQLRPLFPASARVEEIKRGEVEGVTGRTRLLEAITRGQRFVNYVGHGNVNQWRGDLLTSADARAMTNEAFLPVFVMLTCLNGYFHDSALDSLAESLIKAEHGGAIGVWASTGMTAPDEQRLINQQLYKLLVAIAKDSGKDNDTLTLGEAARRAKSVIADADIRRTWIWFGDPMTRLK